MLGTFSRCFRLTAGYVLKIDSMMSAVRLYLMPLAPSVNNFSFIFNLCTYFPICKNNILELMGRRGKNCHENDIATLVWKTLNLIQTRPLFEANISSNKRWKQHSVKFVRVVQIKKISKADLLEVWCLTRKIRRLRLPARVWPSPRQTWSENAEPKTPRREEFELKPEKYILH